MIERTTQITIAPEGESIFSERAFVVEIEDEGGGEFLEVKCLDQSCEAGQLRIDPSEWPILREAINRMVKECRK